jgi:hypothetical protein
MKISREPASVPIHTPDSTIPVHLRRPIYRARELRAGSITIEAAVA